MSLYRVLHKLTPEQREEMIERRLNGETTASLGRAFSVDPSNVGYIVKRHLERLAQPAHVPRAESEWITPREASRLLAVSHATILVKIRQGDLECRPAAQVSVEQRADHSQMYVRRKAIEELATRYGRRLFGADGKTPSAEDCIYLAGLFDGEGCVVISRLASRTGKSSYTLIITLTNTYHEAVDWLYETFGGSIQRRAARNDRWRDQSSWFASSTTAYQTLQRIGPHLRIKHRQAAVAIEFFERTVLYDGHRWRRLTDDERAWRDEQCLLMQCLNARGV